MYSYIYKNAGVVQYAYDIYKHRGFWFWESRYVGHFLILPPLGHILENLIGLNTDLSESSKSAKNMKKPFLANMNT